MITAGIDIGSTTTKVVILNEDTVRARRVVPSGAVPARTAETAFQAAVASAGIGPGDVEVIATTGYGRRLVDFGDKVMTEIKACAAGVRFADSATPHRTHTIVDVGGQDTKVIAVGDDGGIEDFSMNDKCAAGTGRFLEMLATRLGIDYEEFARLAMQAETAVHMSSTCAVFAESEVIGLLARGVSKADIAAAAHDTIAGRIGGMVRRVGGGPGFAFVGGGALNQALVTSLQDELNEPVWVPDHAQTITALGAGVAARKWKMARGD